MDSWLHEKTTSTAKGGGCDTAELHETDRPGGPHPPRAARERLETRPAPGTPRALNVFELVAGAPGPAAEPHRAACVTPEGAAWLASASPYPHSTLTLWQERPAAPAVLPCGTAFDVVNVPVVFGRRMLGRLWEDGPGSGPVAVHRGRMLLFAAPGTAQRLPSLLHWEEWGGAVPTPLCHGRGDAVTVPALTPADPAGPSRWLVAPDAREPQAPLAQLVRAADS